MTLNLVLPGHLNKFNANEFDRYTANATSFLVADLLKYVSFFSGSEDIVVCQSLTCVLAEC